MQLPAAYAATLSAVQTVFPGSMIAGGALRDLDNGRPVKDLDIFAPDVPCFDDLHHRMLYSGLEGHKVLQVMGAYDAWGTQECVGVLDMDSPHGPYQLIGLSTGPETIIPRLDFGICQLGHTGRELIGTGEYLRDKANKTFTLVRSDDSTQRDRSIRRVDRLSEKYHGWRFVDPQDPLEALTLI